MDFHGNTLEQFKEFTDNSQVCKFDNLIEIKVCWGHQLEFLSFTEIS